jgi:sterol desaturase/sphingolipid hydroxylase (fatty acid hydroxylase superfamily)
VAPNTPIWDVLFNTYRAPARNEYPPTGVVGVRIDTVIEASIYPFRKWLARLTAVLKS